MPIFKPDSEPLNINRTKNVPDEKYAEEMRLRKEAIENIYKDKTYDEFVEEFAKHLAGEVDPSERIGDRPETVPWDPLGMNQRSRPSI